MAAILKLNKDKTQKAFFNISKKKSFLSYSLPICDLCCLYKCMQNIKLNAPYWYSSMSFLIYIQEKKFANGKEIGRGVNIHISARFF